ncbi:MAG: gamma-glutamylcyclotransferase family protein [Polaromonas sp.]
MADTLTDFTRHVFVYGTLRRGQERDINRLQPTPLFIGHAQIKGTLYNLGSYPGVRLGGTQWVHGEVYHISAELERQLDDIEEVLPQQTGEYARREVLVQCAGEALLCLVYEVAEVRTVGCGVIEFGDWVKR